MDEWRNYLHGRVLKSSGSGNLCNSEDTKQKVAVVARRFSALHAISLVVFCRFILQTFL